MRHLIILTMVTLFATNNFAQGMPDRPMGPHPQRGPAGKKIEMMKMWKMTEFIDLSEEQAGKFFPRYKALSKEIEKLSQQQREEIKTLQGLIDSDKKISEKDLDKVNANISEIEKKKIDKKELFIKNLGDILNPEQKAKYMVFEVKFKSQLRDAIQNKRLMPIDDRDRRQMRNRGGF